MTIIEFVGTFLLGLLSNALGNDNVAIAQCREDLLDLEKEIEALEGYRNHPVSVMAEKIKNIKMTFKKLNAHHAGLLIKNSELQELIEKSLVRIKGWEIDPSKNDFNLTSFVGADLRLFWSSSVEPRPDLLKIQEFQEQFFHFGLRGRFWYLIKKIKTILIGLLLILLLVA